MSFEERPYLKEIRLKRDEIENFDVYPFCIPAVKNWSIWNIMDEPEAALSPARQMAAVSAIHQLVEENSQLIIATHSPNLARISAVANMPVFRSGHF